MGSSLQSIKTSIQKRLHLLSVLSFSFQPPTNWIGYTWLSRTTQSLRSEPVGIPAVYQKGLPSNSERTPRAPSFTDRRCAGSHLCFSFPDRVIIPREIRLYTVCGAQWWPKIAPEVVPFPRISSAANEGRPVWAIALGPQRRGIIKRVMWTYRGDRSVLIQTFPLSHSAMTLGKLLNLSTSLFH